MNIRSYIVECAQYIFEYDIDEIKIIIYTTMMYIFINIFYPGYRIAFYISQDGEKLWANIAHVLYTLIVIYIISIYLSHIYTKHLGRKKSRAGVLTKYFNKHITRIFIYISAIYALYLALFWPYHLNYTDDLNSILYSIKLIIIIFPISYISQIAIKTLAHKKYRRIQIKYIAIFMLSIILPIILIWHAIDLHYRKIYFHNSQLLNYVAVWSKPIIYFIFSLLIAKASLIAALLQNEYDLQHLDQRTNSSGGS